MPATLDIREIPDGLIIRVAEPRRTGRILLGLLAGIAGTFLFSHADGSKQLKYFLAALCAFAVIRDIAEQMRGTNVELRVTNLDLVSTGHAPDGYGSSTIPRASIYSLTFHEATGGGEDAPHPSGL